MADAADEIRLDMCGASRGEEACTTPSREERRVAHGVDCGADSQAGGITNKGKGNDGTFTTRVKERAGNGAG